MKPCKHENFTANVNVARITLKEDGPVVRYQADLTIKCLDCGLPFEFIGMTPGLVFDQPSCGWDRKGNPEARIPIKPSHSTELN